MENESKHTDINGLLLIDKPIGMSSFDIIRNLRRILGPVKMGHAGTLDPRASGLMIIGLGSGTKHLKECIGLPKVYEATIRIGERRSTGDLEGEIEEKEEVKELEEGKVKEVIDSMVGVHRLLVPRYAAMKQGGERLYKKARKGTLTTIPLRDMQVHDAIYHGMHGEGGACDIKVVFAVASGVYIRSLSEEVGRRLGYPSTTALLRRTSIGKYTLKEAHTLEDITRILKEDDITDILTI